jgi:hypothetical protein
MSAPAIGGPVKERKDSQSVPSFVCKTPLFAFNVYIQDFMRTASKLTINAPKFFLVEKKKVIWRQREPWQ